MIEEPQEVNYLPKKTTYEERVNQAERAYYLRNRQVKSWIPILQLFLSVVGVIAGLAIVFRIILFLYIA